MKLYDFIKTNRKAIDNHIKSSLGDCRLNDEDRRDWVLNDETLYLWAKSEGVNI